MSTNNSYIGVALLTAVAVYILYVKADNTTPTLTREYHNVAEDLKDDLAQLIEAYYQEYIHPHERPHYEFIIPANRSETHNKERIFVMINDPITGEVFDRNTLLQVGAHECAHMLCRVDEVDEHGPLFCSILNKLEVIGKKLDLFDCNIRISQRYKQRCT